jgi:glycosyltransferase involved in cell wall biosynthesis
MIPLQPLVSVVIPVYNKAPWIERCLLSLFASSYPALELVLIDDCSTDDSIVIARKVLASTGFTSVVHSLNSNRGAAVARNTGVALCTGDLIYFLDADDEVRPDGISRLVQCIGSVQSGRMVAFGAAETRYHGDPASASVEREGRIWPLVADERGRSLVAALLEKRAGLWATGAMVIRKEWFMHVCGYSASRRLGEDRELMLKLLLLGAVAWVGSNSPVLTVHRVPGSAWRVDLVGDAIRDSLGNLDALKWSRFRHGVVEMERVALEHFAADSVRRVLVMMRQHDRRFRIVKFIGAVAVRRPTLLFQRGILANLVYGALGLQRGLTA